MSTFGFLVSFFIPELLVSAFTNDHELISLSASALRDATLAFSLIGFQMVTTSLFQCIGMPKISILLSLSRQILILVPTLLIMPIFFGLDGVWYSLPVSDTISSVVALLTLYWFYNSFKKRNRVKVCLKGKLCLFFGHTASRIIKLSYICPKLRKRDLSRKSFDLLAQLVGVDD